MAYSGPTDLPNRRVTAYRSPTLIAEFEMDRRGIRRIALGRDLADACHSTVVQRAMPYAIRISPRGETLDYVTSWRVSDGHAVINGMRRVASKLVNVSDHAAAVEWVNRRGNGHGHRVLGRTLAHLAATSPEGIARAARAAKWNPDLHPRGVGGRFAPKAARGTQATLAAVAARDARARASRAR